MFTYLIHAAYIADAGAFWTPGHHAVLWGLGIFSDILLLAFLWLLVVIAGLVRTTRREGAMARLERFRTRLRRADTVGLGIGAAGLVFLVAITFFSVLGRNLLGTAIPDDITLAEWAMVALVAVMLGGVQGRGEHIEVTALAARFGRRTNDMLRLFGLLVGLFIVGRYAWVNFEKVPDSFLEITYGSIYELPLWPARLLFEVGLIWWCFRIAAQAVLMPATMFVPASGAAWDLGPLLPPESGHEAELTTDDFVEQSGRGS